MVTEFTKIGPMFHWLHRYTHWLHTQWPAGHTESLPVVGPDGATTIPGVFITGDLTGIPLLKFSLDSGVRAVRAISEDRSFHAARKSKGQGTTDLIIIGAGVSGLAAAVEAKKLGIEFRVLESNRPLSTLHNFPNRKPIYTYPQEMTPAGELQVAALVKEDLIEELENQIAVHEIEVEEAVVDRVERRGKKLSVIAESGTAQEALRVILAIGKSGSHRRLEVPGEDLEKVGNRLFDPNDFEGKKVLVVGGGDSALEASIALAEGGAEVTLSYRRKEFSRPKSENLKNLWDLILHPEDAHAAVESPISPEETTASGEFMEIGKRGSVRLELETTVQEIRATEVVLRTPEGSEKTLPNDFVFTMLGREAPLDFFRKSGIRVRGEWRPRDILGMVGFLAILTTLFLWKGSGNFLSNYWQAQGWFPLHLRESLSDWISHPAHLLGTVAISATEPGFYYGLLYSAVVTGFGIRRIRKRRTPYITRQTWTLIAIQVIPLFLLPYLLLPWLGHNNLLPQGLADTFFPEVDYGHGRAYWRAVGFILAWPLFLYNVFTPEPLWGWLAVSFFQTFVLIPGLIYFYGKGVYCGWICSCGALAETLGDEHRHKMPHGPFWNRLNMAGQAILAFTFILLGIRIAAWVGVPGAGALFFGLNDKVYKFGVDLFLSSILGVGLYFWFSGRVWCRFFCPLAALMHVYHRFSRFRIFADKKKCISCNVCTSVCHQGIDVMNFANKGIPMADPQCVRCSACVHSCPTGVLAFGQADSQGNVLKFDRVAASPVQMREFEPK